MAVQQRLFGDWLERQPEATLGGLARDVLLEQQRMRGDAARSLGLNQRRDLIAKTQDAARFEPNDRSAARHERRQRRDAAFGFLPRLLHQSNRQECAPAAQRPFLFARRHWQMDGAAGSVSTRVGRHVFPTRNSG